MRILFDDDVRFLYPMADAIATMRTILRGRRDEHLISPPREGFRCGDAGLVWTPGGFLPSAAIGLRVYLTGLATDDQLVAVWDTESGRLTALAVGSHLGRLRTGAIGGVAMDCLARPDSKTVGVIGFGQQAWFQVEAAIAVRPIYQVVVYRRDPQRLKDRVALAQKTWSVDIVAASSPQEAVKEADIIITATDSASPVLDPAWIQPGAHINALGPKYYGRTELSPQMADIVTTFVSDFPEQYRNDPDFLWYNTPHLNRLQDLAALIDRSEPRSDTAITLFLSHGLSGTEVALLHEVAQRAHHTERGLQANV